MKLEAHEKDAIALVVQKSIHLFGSSDLLLIRYLTGFLCNAVRNLAVKMQLINQNAVNDALYLLHMLYTCSATTLSKDIDDSIDNALLFLANSISLPEICITLRNRPRQLDELFDFLIFWRAKLCVNRVVHVS